MTDHVRLAEVYFFLGDEASDHSLGRTDIVGIGKAPQMPETHWEELQTLFISLNDRFGVKIWDWGYAVEGVNFQVDQYEVTGLPHETPEEIAKSVQTINLIADEIFAWYHETSDAQSPG